MAPSAQKVRNHPTYGRILKVLAQAPHGCDVNSLLSCGFKFATISDLVHAGLAVARLETVKARGRTVEIASIRITDSGLKRLEFSSTVSAAPDSEATLAMATAVSEAEASMAEAASEPEVAPATPHVVEPVAAKSMAPIYTEDILAMATRRVTEGEARIHRVKASIARRREFGLSTRRTENLLNTMLVTLSLMIDCKAAVEAKLERQSTGQNLRGS